MCARPSASIRKSLGRSAVELFRSSFAASMTASTEPDSNRIEAAVAALGNGPLTEAGIAAHVAPLFSRVLARRGAAIDLANHSLGRPLDATAGDVAEAIELWQVRMGDAWDPWLAEMDAYRARLARLLAAPRAACIVPKTSAGQGLRAILNSYDSVPRVVATRGEFDSIDLILRHYAQRGRIALSLVEPRTDGLFAAEDLRQAVRAGVDLVVVSHVLFNTGQVLPDLPALIAAAHAAGARVLLDVYHSLGVFPVTSRRWMSISRSAAATSICAAAPAAVICIFIRATWTDRFRRSTSGGSPSRSRSPTSVPILRASRPEATHSSNPHRRFCRCIRRARGRSSQCRSAWIACVCIPSRNSEG